MNQAEFDRMLSDSHAQAEVLSARLTAAPDGELADLVREYIGCRYLLSGEEMTTDDLVRLGELSTAKLAGLQKSGVRFREKSAGCTTASSGVIKKMLVSIALGRLFGVRLDPDAVAEADTVPQLAEALAQARKTAGNNGGEGDDRP